MQAGGLLAPAMQEAIARYIITIEDLRHSPEVTYVNCLYL